MKYSLLLVLILVSACQSDSCENLTYVGGQIVNPNTNFVTIEYKDEVVDTIFLNDDYSFSYKFDQIEEAVYTFKHEPETQSIYLKPGDSSVFRLNTLEFDESLSFGGDSSVENNFLIDMFLLNESNNDLILSYYKINPKDFTQMTDSILERRMLAFEQLKTKNDFSELFTEIAESTINYEHFDMRERYAFLIRKYLPEKVKELPESYFDYREKVDFNNEKLLSNYSYLRFLDNYLRNKSIELCEAKNRSCFDLNHFDNLKRRLDLVEKLFTSEYLRANFFNRLIRREIVFSKTREQLEETISTIEDFKISSIDKTELHDLAKIQSNYLVGSEVVDYRLRTSKLDTIRFSDLSDDRPIVLYTWSVLSPETHQKSFHKVVNLKQKYPEVRFIGLNLDLQNPNTWLNTLRKHNYDFKNEFQLIVDTPEYNYGFFRNYLNKVYFINTSHEIVDNAMKLHDPHFESELLGLLNQ
ncbi:MAG: TlpA family protein disulfide reductase [Psychroflexus sp.]